MFLILATMLNDSLRAKSVPATGTPGAEALSTHILSTVRSEAPAYAGNLSVDSAINSRIEKHKQLSSRLVLVLDVWCTPLFTSPFLHRRRCERNFNLL
jgi:hypothetical protein